MYHLICFMGGLLALGAYTDPDGLESDRAKCDLKTGKALT
jgi:mannosyl-oligosaccharide alpha-1,2-mannosidase